MGLYLVKPHQSGDTLDDGVTPSGRGEMSSSFGRSQVAETGLMAAVVPLVLMFEGPISNSVIPLRWNAGGSQGNT